MDIPEAIKDLTNLDIKMYRRVWKPFMEKYNCQHVCELGVYEGENFDQMIAHDPQVAIAVDAWIDDGNLARNDSAFSQKFLDGQYLKFRERIANKSFVKVYREYTDQAASHFEDEYFDLIYVDADHSYEGCLKDIEAWCPKVKKGRFLTGDDYRNGYTSKTKIKIGVKQAVNGFARKNNLVVYEFPNHGWAIIK